MTGVVPVTIADGAVKSLSANTTGQFSHIVDIEVPHGEKWEFPATRNHGIQLYVYTHESKTVSATGGSTGTVSLSNDLVNSPARRDIATSSSESSVTGPGSLVVWDDTDDIQTGVNSVDYDANEFDYTNSDASSDDLEVFYLWGDSSQVEFRSYDPAEEDFDKEFITSMRQFHEADVYNENSKVTFPHSFTLDEKQHLKVTVKTDVDLTNWDVFDDNQGGGPGNFTTYSYSYFSLPVKRKKA